MDAGAASGSGRPPAVPSAPLASLTQVRGDAGGLHRCAESKLRSNIAAAPPSVARRVGSLARRRLGSKGWADGVGVEERHGALCCPAPTLHWPPR